MIEIDHLTKRFGPITAVDDVSFFVAQGEVVGFLGPNGAGKSTTMKMATGFLRPTLGTARICDFDVLEDPIEVKQRIGYLPEGAPMWPDMTTAAFLRFIARVRGFDGAEVDEKIAQAIDKTQLASVLEQPIETLSKGYKRRVGLAQALLHDPEVLILDEPTDGLDPNQKHEVRELIHGMSEDKAIVVSTHILEEVEAVCSRAVIIAKGRIVADDTPEELLKKAPDHNAVIIRAADLVAVRAALSGVDGVDGIEDLDQARISVRPSSDAPVVDAVGAALREKGVSVDEIRVERGRLDDVFRQITATG
jgi:ABC-2 type transport system ATP-binding protein